MSKMQEVYQKVAGDANLQAKFIEIIGNAEKSETNDTEKQLLDFTKEAGYDVSIEEVIDFFKNLNEKQAELTEGELDMVAGGKGGISFGDFFRMSFSKFSSQLDKLISDPETFIRTRL